MKHQRTLDSIKSEVLGSRESLGDSKVESKDSEGNKFMDMIRTAVQDKKRVLELKEKIKGLVARETRSLTRRVLRFNQN